MNAMIKHYIPGFSFNTRKIADYANDLSRVQLLTQPMDRGNHFLWILGHITMIRGTMIRLLGGKSGITPEEQQMFGPGSKLTEKDDYPAVEQLLKLFTDRGEELCRLLETADADAMEKESPFRFAFGEKNVGDSIHFLYWHEATHYGELNYIHKLLKKSAE